MPPLRVDKEEKRKQIIHAAVKVFSQKGFHKTTMVEIAENAGIAKGTIYDYFKSKDDLFLELLDHVFEELFEEFAVYPKTGDPAKILEEIFLEGLKTYQRQEHLLRLFILYWGRSLGSERDRIVQQKLRNSFQRNRNWIEKTYLRGVKEGKFKKLNPAHVSAPLMAMAEFIPIQWIVDKKAFSLQQAGKTAFNIWLKGILKTPTQKS